MIKEESYKGAWEAHTLMPALRRLGQEDLSKFEADLVYRVGSRPASSVEWDPISKERRGERKVIIKQMQKLYL